MSKDEANDYARGLGLQYYEVSAKQNMGVEELFKDLAKKLPKESTPQNPKTPKPWKLLIYRK